MTFKQEHFLFVPMVMQGRRRAGCYLKDPHGERLSPAFLVYNPTHFDARHVLWLFGRDILGPKDLHTIASD
jgi:hypothetical protein